MQRYEYKVIPAPVRGEKAKGAKTPADRFAHTLTSLMNEIGAEGWEYLRADTLPAEERVGFTRKVTVYQNLLVFRRTVAEAAGKSPAELNRSSLSAAEPVAGTAPRISVRDDSARPMPTIRLGAAAAPLADTPAPDPREENAG